MRGGAAEAGGPAQRMQTYHAFGGTLRSAIAFPELRPADARDGAPATWTLDVSAPAPFDDAAVVVGAQRYPGDVEVALLRSGPRLRVRTSDIGDFDVAPGGRITWRRPDHAGEDWARFDVIGRVLPILMHLAGRLVLHASSAVLPDGSAVAFLGPKGRGKSTLALAVAQRGGRLLSDDVTVLERAPGDGDWTVTPGVHSVRLWDDSLRGLAADAYGNVGRVGRKAVVQQVPAPLLADRAAAPSALFLLGAEPPSGEAAAERRPLGEREAALSLVRQATAGALLGAEEGGRLLERAASLARRVSAFELRVARGYERLDEVVRLLSEWSGGAPAAAPASRPGANG